MTTASPQSPEPASTSTSPDSEWRALLALALPVLGGQVAQTANGFVDAVMAGAVGPLDLAAVAIGASIWVPVYLFMVGVIIAATPVISRHVGGGRHDAVLPAAWQALWLAAGMGVIGLLAVRNAVVLFDLLSVPADLRALTGRYLDALSFGMPGIALFIGMRSYTESLSHTRPILFISVAGLLANIPLNYVFIHGLFGLPAMGGPGCGAATAIVMWLMCGLLWLYVHRAPHYRHHAPAGTRFDGRARAPNPREILQLLALGLPIGMAIFFEVSIFSIIAVLLATQGPVVVAGHQVALNFASLTFMVPLSLSLALTVRVSYAAGAGNREAARRAVRAGLALATGIAVFNASLLFLARDLIPSLYTGDAAVTALASMLLAYAAVFQLPDALQVAASGALRGFRDTRTPMWITLFAYWGIGLPVGAALAHGIAGWAPLGARGYWIGLISGLVVAALLLNLRLARHLRRA